MNYSIKTMTPESKAGLFDLMTLPRYPMTITTALVFTSLCEKAANGTPVDFLEHFTHAQLGNLSHMKTAGLVVSGKMGKGKERRLCVGFTEAGRQLALEIWGISVPVWAVPVSEEPEAVGPAADEKAAERAAIEARAQAEYALDEDTKKRRAVRSPNARPVAQPKAKKGKKA